MNIKRIVSVFAGALAVGICVYITWISRDIELSSLILNLAFLTVMLLALLAGCLGGMRRLGRVTGSLSRAAGRIRQMAGPEGLSVEGSLFGDAYLDDCYRQYCSMTQSNPDGSCDISDYINEDAIETYIHRSYLELVPDILTSLGILGTFIGLVIGLQSFDPSGYEAMESSVSPLIDGIKVAFVTSIYGLALSLPFSFNLRSGLTGLSSSLDEFLDAFYLHIHPGHEIDSAARLLEQRKSQEELTSDLTRLFVEQMSKSFEQCLTPAFEQMTRNLEQVTDVFTEKQEEAVAKVCKSVLREVSGGMSSDFERIRQTIDRMEKSHSGFVDFMDRSLIRMEQTIDSLQKSMASAGQYNSATLDKLTRAQKEAARITEEQKATYQEYIRFMYQSIEQFSAVWERNNAQLQAYADEIARLGPVQSNREIRNDLARLSEQLQNLRSTADAAQVPADRQTDEMLSQMLVKLDELEKLAASPVLFRRKKQK